VKDEKSSNLRQRWRVTVEVLPVGMQFNATGLHALQAVPLPTDTHSVAGVSGHRWESSGECDRTGSKAQYLSATWVRNMLCCIW